MADPCTWPWRLLRGRAEKSQLVGRVATGGASLSGIVQAVSQTGGGYWRVDLTDIELRSADAIRCARAWAAHLQGGAQTLVVPMWDLGRAPRPMIGGRLGLPGKPAPSLDYFNQDPSYGSPMMVASLPTGAALRATSLAVAITRGTPFRGGETLSIQHPTSGWRAYRVGYVQPATPGSPLTQTIEVMPPLREAAAANTPVELDVPRCLMRLDPSKADALEPDIELNRTATVSASFIEAL